MSGVGIVMGALAASLLCAIFVFVLKDTWDDMNDVEEELDDHACPRCGGCVPTCESKGAYPGALSRIAPVEICSACGIAEALEALLNGSYTSPDQWPVDAIDCKCGSKTSA